MNVTHSHVVCFSKRAPLFKTSVFAGVTLGCYLLMRADETVFLMYCFTEKLISNILVKMIYY